MTVLGISQEGYTVNPSETNDLAYSGTTPYPRFDTQTRN